jgi:hypothetical protein
MEVIQHYGFNSAERTHYKNTFSTDQYSSKSFQSIDFAVFFKVVFLHGVFGFKKMLLKLSE